MDADKLLWEDSRTDPLTEFLWQRDKWKFTQVLLKEKNPCHHIHVIKLMSINSIGIKKDNLMVLSYFEDLILLNSKTFTAEKKLWNLQYAVSVNSERAIKLKFKFSFS